MIQSRSKDTRRKKPVKKAETIPHSLRREKSSTRRIKKMGKGNDAVVSKEFF
jgi:RNase adaptor protein for sRNA GlmZ degradation